MEIGQHLYARVVWDGSVAYAAIVIGGFFEMCKGSNSSMRLAEWLLIRGSISRRIGFGDEAVELGGAGQGSIVSVWSGPFL